MRLKQLEYLIGVCNAGSFSLASEQLHVAQPSISQSISSLEKELGVKIFIRSSYGVQLTEEGRLVLEKAYKILGNVDSLKEEIQSNSLPISGTLRLGIVPSICSSFLPEVIATYKRKYPLVQIEIVEEGSFEVLNDVQTGNVEVGVLSVPKGEQFNDISIQFHELIETRVQLGVGKDFEFPTNRIISPTEIIKHPIVMLKSSYRIRKNIIDMLNNYGDYNVLFTTDNTELSKKVIVEGVAIGFFTDLFFKYDPYVLNGDLIPLEIEDHNIVSSIGWIHSNRKLHTRAAQEFVNELKKQINQNWQEITLSFKE